MTYARLLQLLPILLLYTRGLAVDHKILLIHHHNGDTYKLFLLGFLVVVCTYLFILCNGNKTTFSGKFSLKYIESMTFIDSSLSY